MHPFEEYQAYYLASKKDFCQGDYLKINENGFCNALVLRWLEDIHISNGKHFWGSIHNSSYIEAIKKEQERPISIADTLSRMGFTNQSDFNVAQSRLDDLTIRSATEAFRKENAILFYFAATKKFPGHVIGIARTSEGIAIFDPNYGELHFKYDSKVDLNRKTVCELNHYNDTWQDDAIRTYEDALADILKFYKNDGHTHFDSLPVVYQHTYSSSAHLSSQPSSSERGVSQVDDKKSQTAATSHSRNSHLLLAQPSQSHVTRTQGSLEKDELLSRCSSETGPRK
jgi:hypothetical protein